MSETTGGGVRCILTATYADIKQIQKVRGYSRTLTHGEKNNNNTKAKKKNRAAYNIYHILSWNTHGLYILCKLHYLRHRDYINLCVHHGGLQ